MQSKNQNKSKNSNQNRQRQPFNVFDKDAWQPKTELGRLVKSGEIKDIDEILGSGRKIMEEGIVDTLLKTESDLLLIGQAKGKFGGGQRRIFRQTQKKTREGNKPKFATYAVVGDRNGHVGVGYGKSKETVPAREKALKQAKLNMLTIRRGTGSWQDQSTDSHSIPFEVHGGCGSYRIILMPAPQGKGLICDKEVAKILALAGIKNIWSKSFGQKKNKINVIKATVQALRRLGQMNVQPVHREKLAIIEGSHKVEAIPTPEEIGAENMPSAEKLNEKTPTGGEK